jgi:hypothetical protein
MPQTDDVKQQVAAHWNRRAPGFDADFGHSIRTAAERAAWDRILDLVVGGRGSLDAVDVGCGTGLSSTGRPRPLRHRRRLRAADAGRGAQEGGGAGSRGPLRGRRRRAIAVRGGQLDLS